MAHAASPGPGTFVASPAPPRRNAAFIAGMVLVFVGFFTFMFGTLAAAVTEIVHPALVAGLGFVIIGAGGAVIALGEPEKRAVPPPPAVQPPPTQEARGPVALDCPNCGAPPESVDRFGVATCRYCETRFIVR